jgi:hypothetical protein
MAEGLSRMFAGGGPSTIGSGGNNFSGNTRMGGIDIPPPSEGWDFGEGFRQMMGGWGGYGTSPSTGIGAFGPTQVPTNWINYPGVGLVPMALPNTGPDWNTGIIAGLPGKKES